MQNDKKKSIILSVILTESTSSLLNLSAPHLESFHPCNSKLCVLTATASVRKILKTEAESVENKDSELPTTSLQDNAAAEENGELEISHQIASNVAIFSMSTCSSSSSAVADLRDVPLIQDEECPFRTYEYPVLFEATHVYNRPLFTVRTMAHEGNLDVKSNNEILVSLLDSESTTSADYICRICHGGESNGDLLTPCRCRGTIALIHLKCLEHWLKESNHSHCELCQHHYKIIRQPKYSILKSIFVFLRHPGPHLKEIMFDLLAFSIYTPSALASTYMLMMICEALIKSNLILNGSIASHIVAFTAVLGMAAIDFTYSSWLMYCLQKHVDAWQEWYRSNSTLKVVLPKIKLQPKKFRKPKPQS